MIDAFNLGQDEQLLLGAAALVQLKSYIPYMMAIEQRVAAANIQESMQECLDIAWASEDPNVKAKQQELFGAEKPSLEAFLQRIAEEVSR